MLVRSWVVLIILFLSSRFYRKRIALFSFRDYFFSEAQRSSKDLWWLINFCITFSHPLLYGVHILELGFWQGELSLCRLLLAEGEVLWASLQHSHFNCCLQPLPNQDMASWCLGDTECLSTEECTGQGWSLGEIAQSSMKRVSQNLSVFQHAPKTASPSPHVCSPFQFGWSQGQISHWIQSSKVLAFRGKSIWRIMMQYKHFCYKFIM